MAWLLPMEKENHELPRRKRQGIEHPNRKTYRGKPRRIEPEEINVALIHQEIWNAQLLNDMDSLPAFAGTKGRANDRVAYRVA